MLLGSDWEVVGGGVCGWSTTGMSIWKLMYFWDL
jgi:hypothetical protein